jgi:phosphatidylglycerol:prolipoprotein diacylglycerol transferase
MKPVLFTWDWVFGPLTVRSYEAALLLAAALTVALSYVLAVRRGLPRRGVVVVLLCSGLAVLAGARVTHIIAAGEWGPGLLKRLLDLRLASFSLSGGLLAGILAGWVISRQQGVCAWRLADACAPAIALGIAASRVGCFLQGCCFGVETRLPLGVCFPWGSPAHLHQLASGQLSPLEMSSRPVYPTQLYELVAASLTAAVAGFLLCRRIPDGSVIMISAAMFLSLRELGLTQRAITNPGELLNLILLAVVAALFALHLYEQRVNPEAKYAALR